MSDQQTCASPVIVTLPAQLDAAAAEQAADQITAAFTPGGRVVIADLTAAACCDRSAIRNLLKAHRKATARGRQVRHAIRPGGPCTRSPASPALTRCWRSIPPSSTPRPASHQDHSATAACRRPRSARRHVRRSAGPPRSDNCKPDYPDARSDGPCTAQRVTGRPRSRKGTADR